MAYSFNAASAQRIFGSIPNYVPPITIAAWYNRSATTTQTIVSLDTTSASQRMLIRVAGSTLQVEILGTFLGGLASSTNSDTVSVYNHSVGRLTSIVARDVVLNNTVGTTNTTGVQNPTIISNLNIGTRRVSTLGEYFTGQISEVAVWTGSLTNDDVNSLYKGFKSTRVRPELLLYYIPLIRDVNELKTGISLTTENSPTVADHPRVY